MTARTLHFKTNTLLKDLVGRDLINDDNIAVVELVKNSYDAGSRRVVVKFKKIKNKSDWNQSEIIISDAGTGMNASDIENKWLNIAYSEKRSLPRKPGKYLAGNKGVGRFSCDRLGERLDLYTRKQGHPLLHLKIEWPDFETEDDRDKIIQDVGVRLTTSPTKSVPHFFADDASCGTVLIISRLRSDWDREKLLELKKSLEKFINPNQTFSADKFMIQLSAEEFLVEDKAVPLAEKINGQIKNQIFSSLEFKTSYVESVISEDGSTIQTRLYHEGTLVFELEEQNESYPLLKAISITIYYLNPYKKSYFKRQTGVRAIDFGSIFLFLNGFRVAPYGERGDDWLGLDIRKGQGHARYLGSRDLIGRIEIADQVDAFKPISSREGLKRTPALNQLKDQYFFEVLKKLEKFVVDGLAWDSVSEDAKNSVRNEEGLDWKNTREDYSESWPKKQRRVAVMMMNIIGTSPDKALKFWFNPELLEALAEERSSEFDALLSQLGAFSAEQVDNDLSSNVARITQALQRKADEVRQAKRDIADLRATLAAKSEEIVTLKDTADSYRAQTLFMQSATTLNADNLRAFHHQIFLESTILGNYVSKSIKLARNKHDLAANHSDLLAQLNKISLSNQKIVAIAQFATKANFKAGVKKEPTDIPAFFEQYLLKVAPDFIGSGINISVDNNVWESFEIRVSRIELSIVIDNLISNSGKAMARNIWVSIRQEKSNKLVVIFSDDGRGLSSDIHDIDSIFELGITTTNGSGIGLNYVKSIIEGLGGRILVKKGTSKGTEFEMEFFR